MRDNGLRQQLEKALGTIRTLQDELAETNRGLIALTMELEKRVDERTVELRAAQEELQKTNSDLLQLTMELEDRVDERTAQLKEHHATLNAILESSPMPVFSLDRQYRYTSFNTAHAAMMKAIYGAEIEIGQNMLEYQTVPEDWEAARKNLDRALHGEQFVESAFSGEPGATRRYFEVAHNPICGNDGVIIGISVFASDITGSRQAADTILSLARFPTENPNPVLRIDRDGNLLYANEAAFALLNDWNLEQGKPAPDELQAPVFEVFAINKEKTVEISSGERTFSITIAPAPVDEYVNLYGSDITGARQSEEKLRTSEARYRRLFEAARDGILILDAETGLVVDVNQFMLDLLGFSREAFQGKKLWELGFFKDIAASQANFLELQQKEYIRYENLPLETAQGRQINVEFVSNVYQVDHHKVVQCNIRDITERQRAEETLRESENRFRSLFENMLNGFAYCRMLIDEGSPPDFLYLEVNRAFETLTGLKAVAGKKVSEVIPGIQASEPELLERYARVSLTGLPESFETYIEVLKMWFFISVYSPQKGYFVTVFDVITERKQAEEQIAKYTDYLEEMVNERTRELREAQEKMVRQERLATLGQVAGSLGHELRNPLGVISNAVYFLKMTQPDASQTTQEYLDIIEKETRTSDKIITSLLDFTRIKAVDREPASVADLIALTFKRYAMPASVEVLLDLPADLPLLYADSYQVVQVLGNLVTNACQAMLEPRAGSSTLVAPAGVSGAGKLTLSASQQSDMIAIAVQDTGVGIPPENMGKLFEPLFTTKINGIGLGLAVSQKLAEANGGRIEARSQPGLGSTFTVYLPVFRS